MWPRFAYQVEHAVFPYHVDERLRGLLSRVEPMTSVVIFRILPFRFDRIAEEHEAVDFDVDEFVVLRELYSGASDLVLLHRRVLFELEEIGQFLMIRIIPEPREVLQILEDYYRIQLVALIYRTSLSFP